VILPAENKKNVKRIKNVKTRFFIKKTLANVYYNYGYRHYGQLKPGPDCDPNTDPRLPFYPPLHKRIAIIVNLNQKSIYMHVMM